MPSRIIMFAILVVLYGLSYGEVRISQGDTVSSTKQIEMLIERYGKRRLIEFILKKKSGQITLDINGKLQTSYGSPNPSYVTPQTILIDLDKVNISPNDLAKDIDLQESMQKKDAEKQRVASSQRQTPSSASPGTPRRDEVPGIGHGASNAEVWCISPLKVRFPTGVKIHGIAYPLNKLLTFPYVSRSYY